MDFQNASKCIVGLYSGIFLLHRLLPALSVKGYCCDSDGKVLTYRLNGVFVYATSLYLFYYHEDLNCTLPYGITRGSLYNNFAHCATSAFFIGLILSLWFYFRGYQNAAEKAYSARSRCLTIDQINSNGKSNGSGTGSPQRASSPSPSRRRRTKTSHEGSSAPTSTPTGSATATPTPSSVGAVFFLGREWNPRILGADMKMYLYLAGAIMLQMILCSALEVQKARSEWKDHRYSSSSLAMRTYVGCFSWFLFEYLANEDVHLYTYDLFAEKVGFKLVWGCLFFYPFFYCIGVHPLVGVTPDGDIQPWQAAFIIALFFIGWIITRGANLQKFFYKTQPECRWVFGGLVEQRCLPNTHLLISGFWGVSRHFNYFGEIIQALALALPALLASQTLAGRCLALLYPLYYVGLFVPRQQDDDRICAAKYGENWSLYEGLVRWRIVPGVW